MFIFICSPPNATADFAKRRQEHKGVRDNYIILTEKSAFNRFCSCYRKQLPGFGYWVLSFRCWAHSAKKPHSSSRERSERSRCATQFLQLSGGANPENFQEKFLERFRISSYER